MSSPAGAPSAASAAKEGKGKDRIEKVLNRMRSVFKRGESSRRKSGPPPSKETSEPKATTAAAAKSEPVPPATKKQPEYPGATKIPKSQIQEERAKKLGARFGLEIKPSEWHSTEGDVLRVEKSVRMRIHRECHRCHTAFGATSECPGCQHTRCKKCTRYPSKRNEREQQANREKREALAKKHRENAPIIPSYDYAPTTIVLKRPSKTGGQDLVFRKHRMRVRRFCHVCNNQISAHAKQARTCDNCGHRRCGDCPRTPDERAKYPYGYPNDEPGEKFKGVHSCHECGQKFPPNADNGADCPNCSHRKCPDCRRVRPRKVEPELSPEALESLRLRWEELKLGES
ncbi:hypothetical protein DL765_011470 [Monosporascus sp. GIB2]|nr:hypothetical protein DL765_011470 [Monosporascus sp. GIB2]